MAFEAQFLEANRQFRESNFEEACRLYREIADGGSEAATAVVFNNWGLSLLQLKRFAEARDKFEIAVLKDKQYEDAYWNLAVACINTVKNEKAIQALEALVSINPNHIQAEFLGGKLLRHIRKPNWACEKFRSVLAKDPNHEEALNLWCQTVLEIWSADHALKQLTEILTMKPFYEPAILARITVLKNWFSAGKYLKISEFEFQSQDRKVTVAIQATEKAAIVKALFGDIVNLAGSSDLGGGKTWQEILQVRPIRYDVSGHFWGIPKKGFWSKRLDLLISDGFIDLAATNAEGNSVFHLAATAQNNEYEDIRHLFALIEHGFSPNIVNNLGQLPLHLALKEGWFYHAVFLIHFTDIRNLGAMDAFGNCPIDYAKCFCAEGLDEDSLENNEFKNELMKMLNAYQGAIDYVK